MTTRKYALKKDCEDARDLILASKFASFPESVDLRPKDAAAIFDQGALGSCTANAICAFHSFLQKRTDGYFFNLSRLFLYWHERNLEGTVEYDSGAYIRDGMKVLQQIGCAGESDFPYVEATFRDKPSSEAEASAIYHKIASYHRILAVAQLKESLVSGFPVVMGIEIYSSFESSEVARTGIVPMPNRDREYSLGGHAVLAMGYTVINGIEYIICRNSWGSAWGDKGYFYLPMAFIGRYVSDMWTGR
jgi:C1A family cysteine protease